MKKLAFFCVALMASASASAVQLSASGNVTTADCTLLKENVRINLSNGVVAGVACGDAGIALSACHTKGKVTSRTVNVVTVAESVDPAIPEHIESCTIGETPGCAETLVTGPAMPTATTALGTVNTQYPGGNCDAAGAEANSTVHQPR